MIKRLFLGERHDPQIPTIVPERMKQHFIEEGWIVLESAVSRAAEAFYKALANTGMGPLNGLTTSTLR